MRWVALVALVMAGVMGTAEAAHIHGDFFPHKDHQIHATLDHGSQPGGQEHCPICVAMHSALPSALVLAPQFATAVSEAKLVEREVVAPQTHWHFALFSRPPPADLS